MKSQFNHVYESVLSENSQTRFKKAMYGVLPNVKSFVIITPENPMGEMMSKKENMKRIADFKKYLKDGKYKYIRVKGKYDNKENPFVVFNVSVSGAKKIGNQYNRESFIYAKNKNEKQKEKNVLFEYYQKDKNKPYKKLDEIDYFDFKDDAEDFFTRLKSWKFNIPFSIFEEIINHNPYNVELNENVIECINNFNEEIILDNSTLNHQYKLRCYINACINTNKIFDEISIE